MKFLQVLLNVQTEMLSAAGDLIEIAQTTDNIETHELARRISLELQHLAEKLHATILRRLEDRRPQTNGGETSAKTQ